MVHLYYGDGKGKTTAAMGLALRAAGHEKKIVIVQFLKTGTSGECKILGKLKNVTLLAVNPVRKFSFAMSEQEKSQTKQAVLRTFDAAIHFIQKEQTFLLVLDEVCAAISCGFLPEQLVIDFLKNRPQSLEVVLTGRNPSEFLLQHADYVSEIHKIRHPFDQGVGAREGIEQ